MSSSQNTGPERTSSERTSSERTDPQRINSENIRTYVERMASDAPAPGGGAAGALQAALGAALLAMSARYSTGSEHAADAAARAEELIPAALRLADADAEAFGELSAAFGLPRDTDEQRAARSRAVQEATAGAARPPQELIGVGADVLGLARELNGWCNPNVLSDVAAAVEAARAAVATALVTLEINVRSLKDEAVVEQLRAEVARGERAVEDAAELSRRIRERVQD
ncbi:cyclodeaminase/cyclohydrolase family protein [Kocuria turfanensis]|uniref:cyclodeaminase/cyclohydrolase family protein n=1 Tax=Kocuria turfanensis TaxID=388357 RepID=UPI000AF5D90F|nr:cyclodeaminase/cyclohydrolase family protein [Kocuria turfanensis]